MRFRFHVGSHIEEKAAAEIGRQVAGILRARGHEVQLEKADPARSSLNLLATTQRLSSMEMRTRASQIDREIREMMENAPADAHFIDFHCSPAQFFSYSKPPELDKGEIRIQMKGFIPVNTPFALMLYDGTKNGYLHGSIEVPALAKPLPARAKELLKRNFEILKRGVLVPSFFNAVMHMRRGEALGRTYPFDPRLHTPAFIEHAADEIERIAQEEEEWAEKHPKQKGEQHRLFVKEGEYDPADRLLPDKDYAFFFLAAYRRVPWFPRITEEEIERLEDKAGMTMEEVKRKYKYYPKPPRQRK